MTPIRLPLLGNLPGSVRHVSRITSPAVRRGWLDDGPGPHRPARRRRVRRRVVGRAHRAAGRRTAPRRRHPRQRGDLRRFLRLGQRGPIPPRPEPGASIPELPWRLHIFAPLLQPRRDRGDHAAGGRHPRRPVQAVHPVGRHRRTHRPDGVFRRAGAEEHRRQPRWHHRTSGPRRAAPLPGTRRPDRVVLAAARRRRRRRASGTPRCPAPTWRSCSRWPTCWPPNRWPTATSSPATAPDTSDSSATCSAPTTVCPKSPQWAAAICGLAADDLTALARRMAAARTIVTVSWSLQRTRHGEQAPWMGLTLAAMLGQIGLPGGGFGHGYGSMNEPGLPPLRCGLPRLPQGVNPVSSFIPVAAVSDMLLHPGEPFDYNGLRLHLPGHQAGVLGRRQPVPPPPEPLRGCGGRSAGPTPWWCTTRTGRRWPSTPTSWCRRPPRWSATTTPVPATTRVLMAMPQLTEPYAQSRDDYQTFAALAAPTGLRETSSPRVAPHGSGWRISTKTGPQHWISRFRPSTSSGRPAGCGCRPKTG